MRGVIIVLASNPMESFSGKVSAIKIDSLNTTCPAILSHLVLFFCVDAQHKAMKRSFPTVYRLGTMCPLKV